MPTKQAESPKASVVTVSPKGSETVHLKHRQPGRHQQPDWLRQQEADEAREAEEIERLAAGELRSGGGGHVISTSTGRVVSKPQSREQPPSPAADTGGGQFQGEWNWDMGAMDRQRATQERHAALLQDVDELGAQLDGLEGEIQKVPAVPNLNANDFLDIITGDASEAKLEFNQKSVAIVKKCREIRAGRARAEKELAKKRLLVQKVADAQARLLEAESRAQLTDAADDVSEMRDLVKDARRRVDEVKFAVSQQERQLETMEQAVRAELFGRNPKGKNKARADAFNIYSLVDEADGSVTRPGKPERLARLHKEKERLQREAAELAAEAEARHEEEAEAAADEEEKAGVGAGEGEGGEDQQLLSEEKLTEEVQVKAKKLQRMKTVLAATKARISALGAERAKNVAKIVTLLEDSDARDAQVKALQAEHQGLQGRLNEHRHQMEAAREEESARERANMRALTETLEGKITAKSQQLTRVKNELERQELELADARNGLHKSSVSQADTRTGDARAIRALQVENQRLGERLQMLEAALEEKARAVEAVVDDAAALRKANRGLDKKLAKLPVKRSSRGSSREALAQLQHQIEQQRKRTADLVDGFRRRLAAKQARVQAYRDEAEQYRKQINTRQGQRPQALDDVRAENAALRRRLQSLQ